ncbi:MAG TPA: cupin domain-containing protein [Candidatus Binatia bacterium]|jgi:mannose-6-phosphate isomerase-like protein (cupin superfamily)|nr:cupin domain-containing protein [Candidatus Binatia bacterium]
MAQDAKEFRHQTPEFEGVKKTWQVCNSDLMKVQVQVVKNGGENNLHTHTGEDAFWYVIKGAVKFYGEGDKLVGEYQKGEGILVPRGYKYWFESASPEPLEILRVTAKDQNIDNKRVDLAAQKQWMIEQNTFGNRQ